MKTIYKPILLLLVFLISNYLFAQQGHNSNIVKQQQNALRVTSVANVNARIHANSNSVFGTTNSSTTYTKKDPPKIQEVKPEVETKKNNKGKKQKR